MEVAVTWPAGKEREVGDGQPPEIAPTRSGLSDQARLAIAVVLACALLGSVAVGVLLGVRYAGQASDAAPSGAPVNTSMAQELQTRQAVQTAVGSFVANLNTYSVQDIDGYRNRLLPLMTPGFAQSFKLAVDNIVQQVKATKMASDGEVLETAISSVDSDSATVLVVADAHVTSSLGERLRHFRWKVTLVNRSGDWLVDNFEPVV